MNDSSFAGHFESKIVIASGHPQHGYVSELSWGLFFSWRKLVVTQRGRVTPEESVERHVQRGERVPFYAYTVFFLLR